MLLRLLGGRARALGVTAIAVAAIAAGAGSAEAGVTAPDCAPSLEAVCTSTVDPQVYCASPSGAAPDCLYQAITAIRAAAVGRAEFCATNSSPAGCEAAMEEVLPHAEAYLAEGSGCLSWLTATGDHCASTLSSLNIALAAPKAALAIPDPVTMVEDFAADLAVQIDDAGFRNSMCATNAIMEMTDVTIALGERSSPAQVQSCLTAKGNGGVTYYRTTNEYGGAGTSSPGSYTRTVGNWLRVKSCRFQEPGGTLRAEHQDCTNRVWLTNADGSICCRGYQDPQPGGKDRWTGHDYPRTKGRPHCQFAYGASGAYGMKTVEKFSCYYRY